MLIKIIPPPGIITELGDYTAGKHWVTANNVRFRMGLPEKIGGWTRFSTNNLSGVPRSIFEWRNLSGLRHIATGTQCHLTITIAGTHYDVTPYAAAAASLGTDPISVTDTSTTVTITHNAHGIVADDRVLIAGAAAVGGITISGVYTIASVVDNNSYTITHSSAATSTATGGGASVTAQYTVTCGYAIRTKLLGWGAGAWAESTWGTARSDSDIFEDFRYWSLANWGEDLIAGRRDGKIYVWDSSTGTGTRATEMSNAPSQVNLVDVYAPDRRVIAFGAHDGSAYDPLLIRWTTDGDYTTWTAAAGNTAGDLQIASGNQIVSRRLFRGGFLVWTDDDLFYMLYDGPPFIFRIEQVGSEVGAIGVNSTVIQEDRAYWMSKFGFHIFDGVVRELPCPVKNQVFDSINLDQGDTVFAGLNEEFNEIWWFYASSGVDYNNRYVAYNYVENTWFFGTMSRTTWLPQNLHSNPIATATGGTMYSHESGADDTSATGATSALAGYIETGEFELGEGDRLILMNRLIPANTLTSTGNVLQATVYTKRYPDSTAISSGARSINSTTEKVDLRARGRTFRIRIENTDTSNDWRLGMWRADIQPDGKR